MVKALKNFLLQNQESFEAESLYTASGTQGPPFVQMMTLGLKFCPPPPPPPPRLSALAPGLYTLFKIW